MRRRVWADWTTVDELASSILDGAFKESFAKNMYKVINRCIHVPPKMPEADVMNIAKTYAMAEMNDVTLMVDVLFSELEEMQGMFYDKYYVVIYLPVAEVPV